MDSQRRPGYGVGTTWRHATPGIPKRKEGLVPEPSAIEGVLSALVEAMEAREAAEPDLPEWEANARLHAAEASLLRMYRESGRNQPLRVGFEIEVSHASLGPTAVEVA